MLFLVTSLLTLFSILSFTSAQKSSNNDSSAVFVYEGDLNTQLVFALNADKSTGDLYFHLESPAGNSWVGVGIGEEMKGSLMLIAYPNRDNGVTISPRVADGHSEPVAQGDITISKLGTNAITGSGRNKKIVVDGVCRKCTSWKYGGSIDLSSRAQPFIFAVGPSFPATQSGNTDASLSRHEFYGDFTMDMTAATSSSGGSVPLGPYVTKDASQATDTKLDRDPAPHIHGVVMSIVFILLLPLSSLLLRVWHKVKGHMWVNIVATVLFFMAFAGGIVISQQYNKSKHFNSAHQVIGILILLAFIAQLTLGILHHRIYKREQRKTIMSKIHLGLGPAIIFFGLINGGIGFSFAGMGILAVPYVIVILLFVVIYLCIRGGTWFARRRRNKHKEGHDGYQYPQFGHTQQPYGQAGDTPPAYPPPYSQQDVPLTRFESPHNVSRGGTPPVQPRPMI